MDPVHATDEIVAEGSIVPRPSDEDGRTGRVRIATLYLDADSKFRWYEDGEATGAAALTLRTAIAAARLKWPRFQVVMLKGKPVVHLTEADIPNIYAADELDRTRKSKKEV
jgi:hypothetical protein